MTTALPEFSTNQGRGDDRTTVAGDLVATVRGIVDGGKLADAPMLDIASAYFNAAGYGLLADALDEVGPIRLLLGAEPTDAQVRETVTSLEVRRAPKGDPRIGRAVAQHDAALKEDRDLAGFGPEADALVERLISWLEREDVEVRRLERGFLHGKAYILSTVGESVLAGSSNFTRAGLSLNRELNLGAHAPSVVAQVRDWFDEQWDMAEPYDLAELYRARRVPHDPHLVFMRMLLALYGDDLEENPEIDNELGLLPHQLDGVFRARRILAKRNGVIVADEVGLGKTHIAGELIREAAIERRQKVLVVAPAALRDATWVPFLKEHNLPASVVSFEELVLELDQYPEGGMKVPKINEVGMVVVDEAHHMRNSSTDRAAAMRTLLSGKVAKELVLLSATPVNNSLKDLHNLIGYITPSDGAFADIGVSSLAEYFDRAMKMDPDELSGEHLFDVLDAIAVRRTRRFLQKEYPRATMPNGKPIVFPEAKVHRVDYDLSQVLPGFFPRFAAALGVGLDDEVPDDADVLSMARYVPSRYATGSGDGEQQYQVQNAGLLQSALLKRFESSSAAFCKTLRVMQDSHEQFLGALDDGYVLTGKALSGWVATDTDDVDHYVEELDDDLADNVASASDYDVDLLREHVERDLALLRDFEAEVGEVTPETDPKIAALADVLAQIASEAKHDGVLDQDVRDRRKTLVFTYFADTADYVADAVRNLVERDPRLAAFRGRIAAATGDDRLGQRKAIIGFAPRTAAEYIDAEDKYDVLIATDVLAEGVNLQQAGQIINYDLPWNPMRLVQRHGRVDRIGSTHARIHLRCFFPDEGLEELLTLERRLQLKLKHAAAAFGVDEVLPGMESVERTMSETREEIDKLRREETAIFDPSRGASASSEEFQRRLDKALEASGDQIRNLPWGAGTGILKPGVRSGVVFCAQVADHPRPRFRFVPLERHADGEYHLVVGGDGVTEVDDTKLIALNAADPGAPDVPAHFTEPMHRAAFKGWEVAKHSIFEEWLTLTDPANIQPKVPRAMLDAAAFVETHGAFLADRQDRVVARLRQVVPQRNQNAMRATLREHAGDAKQCVQAIVDLADEWRLAVPEPLTPEPPIEMEDIRVLAWAVVVGEEDA